MNSETCLYSKFYLMTDKDSRTDFFFFLQNAFKIYSKAHNVPIIIRQRCLHAYVSYPLLTSEEEKMNFPD